jgi:dTDP-4-dehydrorhamnose reductase
MILFMPENALKFLITGSQGQLGREFCSALERRGMPFLAPAEADCNITDQAQIERVMQEAQPDIVLNCAAYNNVDKAEDEPAVAMRVNAQAPADLAESCRRHGAFLVHFSTDYVFDGKKGTFYAENDTPAPLNVYGRSKWKGEQDVRRIMPDASLVFRLSWLFGAGEQNFLHKLLLWSATSKVLKIASDEISAPTYTVDVVDTVLAALRQGVTGLYHLTNTGACSRYDWARYFFEKKGIAVTVMPAAMNSFALKARRPLCSPMSNREISTILDMDLSTWEDAVSRFVSRG